MMMSSYTAQVNQFDTNCQLIVVDMNVQIILWSVNKCFIVYRKLLSLHESSRLGGEVTEHDDSSARQIKQFRASKERLG